MIPGEPEIPGEEPEIKREYRQYVPIENLVSAQINRIAEYRSKKRIEHYEESVDMLIDLLPPDAEAEVLEYKKKCNIEYDLSLDGKQLYVDLFRFMKKLLADKNIVWKRSGGYEVGHD